MQTKDAASPKVGKTVSGPPVFGAELFRRILLGATAALLTARMLAPGEDPGMLQPASGPTNLLLPLFWLLTAVGWGVWRAWSRRGEWRGGLVEAALLLAVLLVFVAAEMASYKHTARIIAWDWLILFLVVILVRQLAVSPADRQGLFAVFLAGAAALSAQAVYQALAAHVPSSATFAQPQVLDAWLALFLPGLFIVVFVCQRRRAFWLAILTGLGAAVAASAFGFAVTAPSASNEPPLLEVWRAAGKMILAHPLGVGPGNFSRVFPRFVGPNNGAVIADPHNFILEIAATGGVAALLAVLAALGAFFAKAVRSLRKSSGPMTAPEAPETEERTRWEFYLGGMCGLVLGFVIRQTSGERGPEDILTEGFIACGRCLVWLTAFIVFERIPLSGRVRLAALTFGVAALLAMLLANPGVGLPSAAVALWAALALALNEMPQRDYPRLNRLAAARILPGFAVVALALVYFLAVFVPVTGCSDKVQQALRATKAAHTPAQLNDYVLLPLHAAAKDDAEDVRVPVLLAHWTGELGALLPGGPTGMKLRAAAVRHAVEAQKLDTLGRGGYVEEYNIRMRFAQRLDALAQRGPDPAPSLTAAAGLGSRMFLALTRWPHPLGRGAVDTLKQRYREAVLAGKEEDVNAYGSAVQYMEAAAALEKYLPNDPNDAALRFRLVDALFKAWEDDHCREQTVDVLRLDAAAPSLLTDEQRRKLQAWKELPPVK